MEDQFGFILNHRVMKKEQDKDFDMAKQCQQLFPGLASMSFDKDFHSKRDAQGKNNHLDI